MRAVFRSFSLLFCYTVSRNYVQRRHYEADDIRLLAEAIYSAKFLTEKQSQNLVNVVCEFVSEHQAESIRHDAFLTNRVRTINKSVIANLSIINAAMSKVQEGQKHIPEKISLKGNSTQDSLKHYIHNELKDFARYPLHN